MRARRGPSRETHGGEDEASQNRRADADESRRRRAESWGSKHRIREILNRAGIVEPRPLGGGTLAAEPILVWRGGEGSDLQAYDQRGRWIGEAIRNRDRYSVVRCHFHYDISDVELRCVVADATNGRWRWTPKKFSITAPDGTEVALATRPQPEVPWAFERHGEPIATLREVDPTVRGARDDATSLNPVPLAGQIFDSIVQVAEPGLPSRGLIRRPYCVDLIPAARLAGGDSQLSRDRVAIGFVGSVASGRLGGVRDREPHDDPALQCALAVSTRRRNAHERIATGSRSAYCR
jgi:hypothetical protein